MANVSALKFRVSVRLMRYILSINTPCVRLSVKFMSTEFTHGDLHEEKASKYIGQI